MKLHIHFNTTEEILGLVWFWGFFGVQIFWFHWADGHLSLDGLSLQGQSKQTQESSYGSGIRMKKRIAPCHIWDLVFVLTLQTTATPWPAAPVTRCMPGVSFPGHSSCLILFLICFPLNWTNPRSSGCPSHHPPLGHNGVWSVLAACAHGSRASAATPAPRPYNMAAPRNTTLSAHN